MTDPQPFVPADFDPPRQPVTDHFRLEPLGPEHNEADLAAWGTRVGARSPGARAIQQFTEDVLGRVGLASMLTQARELPRFAGPMPSLGGGRDLRARMTAARPRLQAYFAGPPSAA